MDAVEMWPLMPLCGHHQMGLSFMDDACCSLEVLEGL